MRSRLLTLGVSALLLSAAPLGCTDRTIGPTLEQLVDVEEERAGEGPRAKPGECVTVTYAAWLEDGTPIEKLDLRGRGKSHSFFIGDGTVIAGIDHAVRDMQVGGMKRVLIQPNAHWGRRGYGGEIPEKTPVRFEIELIRIQRDIAPPRRPLSDPVQERRADERWG